MSTIVVDNDTVEIPEWVKSLASFRRWARSGEFPNTGRICYIEGGVWVDMSKEQLFTHNQVKFEYGRVLGNLAVEVDQGRYFPDGILVTNLEAGLSTQPDGTYVLYASLVSGRIRMIQGKQRGFVELEGSADMILEVVSNSSQHKDLVVLREQYWEAQVQEYWLVDARREELEFSIFRRGLKGYVAARKHDGWLRSAVFGRSFRLTADRDALGNPLYRLHVK